MDDQLKAALAMYPKAKYLYRTSDAIIHTRSADARAQARHLADSAIEKIECKNFRASSAK